MYDTDKYLVRLAVVEVGLGGVSAQTGQPGTRISIPDGRLTPYLGELCEGGVVIDKRAALAADGGLAVRCPMLDSGLAHGTV